MTIRVLAGVGNDHAPRTPNGPCVGRTSGEEAGGGGVHGVRDGGSPRGTEGSLTAERRSFFSSLVTRTPAVDVSGPTQTFA